MTIPSSKQLREWASSPITGTPMVPISIDTCLALADLLELMERLAIDMTPSVPRVEVVKDKLQWDETESKPYFHSRIG